MAGSGLPIVSEAYQPNPALNIESYSAGLKSGQGIVGGALDAANSVADLGTKVQNMELKPQELDLKKQQIAADQEATASKEQLLEDRAQREQDRLQVQDDYNNRRLDLRQQGLDLQARRVDKTMTRAETADAVRQGKEAGNEQYDNVVGEFLQNGNIDSIIGEVGDISTPAGRRRAQQFTKRVASDPTFGQAVIDKVEDQLSSADLRTDHRQALENLINGTSYSNKILSTQESYNTQALPAFRSLLGVVPDLKSKVKYKANADSIDVFETFPEGDGRAPRQIGTVPKDEVTNKNDLYKAIATHNRFLTLQEDQKSQIQKSVEKVADTKAAQDVAPAGDQATRPARQVDRSNYQRLGLMQASPGAREENAAVSQVRNSGIVTPSKEQIRIRNRALIRAGLPPLDENTGKPTNPDIGRSGIGGFG